MTPIKLARVKAGISIKEAATALGISRSYLYKIEISALTPGRDLLRRMAELYGEVKQNDTGRDS